MNKKANTFLFILGATVFNILITVLAFLLLLVVYGRFIGQHLPETARAWAFPVIFIAAMAVAFLIYRGVLRLLLKKIDVEKYFDPIFVNRHRR